ncbi:MAG: RDD family protein [Mariprofundaceae bacterium]
MADTDTQAVKLKGTPAGILLRFLASGYDLVILVGLLFFTFIPIAILEQGATNIPLWLKQLLFMTVAFAYFVGFWHKAGMTTGMRPWSLRIAMVDTGNHPSMTAAAIRFVALGLTWIALGETFFLLNIYIATGNIDRQLFAISSIMPALSMFIMILTPQRQALHDLVSGTSVFRVAKPK